MKSTFGGQCYSNNLRIPSNMRFGSSGAAVRIAGAPSAMRFFWLSGFLKAFGKLQHWIIFFMSQRPKGLSFLSLKPPSSILSNHCNNDVPPIVANQTQHLLYILSLIIAFQFDMLFASFELIPCIVGHTT